MVRAIKEQVTVGLAGRVVIDRSDLPEGSRADVIVLITDAGDASSPSTPRPLQSFFGSCKGQFESVEAADAYVRAVRDEWEQR